MRGGVDVGNFSPLEIGKKQSLEKQQQLCVNDPSQMYQYDDSERMNSARTDQNVGVIPKA